MPASGIKPTDEVKAAYQQVHKSGKGIPYAVFRFAEDLKSVIIDGDEKFYAKRLHYNELMALMPSCEPRFVAFEFPHSTKDTGAKTKSPIFVSWFPCQCGLKMKFLVGATSLALFQDVGAKKYIEGDDICELDEVAVCKKFDWIPLTDDQREDHGNESVDVYKVD